jgi:predicted RNase H-like nuclease (RuvC/YqgF family)
VTPATQRERGNRSQDVVAALHAQNERLRLENERLRMLLEEKGAQIAELEERVARLERLISRNSGNSSMPRAAGRECSPLVLRR